MTSPLLGPGGRAWTASDVNNLHRFSDVDTHAQAHHHTLGTRKNQAAEGDHLHAGQTLLFSDITRDWVSYTTAWGGTGWASGNAVDTSEYYVLGKWCEFRIKWTFGSTSTSGTGALTVSLPLTFGQGAPAGTGRGLWIARWTRTGTASYMACNSVQSGSNVIPGFDQASHIQQQFTTANLTTVTGAAPVAGDIFECSGAYRIG